METNMCGRKCESVVGTGDGPANWWKYFFPLWSCVDDEQLALFAL
jgi:hypothetical protein